MYKYFITITLFFIISFGYSQYSFENTSNFESKISKNIQNFSKISLKFNTKDYPGLSSFNDFDWSIPKEYERYYEKNSLLTEQTWESARVLKLNKELWSSSVSPMSKLLYLPKSEMIFCYSKNKYSIVNKKGEKVFEKNINPENKFERKVTSVCYNKQVNKVFYTTGQFDDYCENPFWEISSLDLVSNEIVLLANNQSSKYTNFNEDKTGKCAYFSQIKVSESSLNIALNYIDLEFGNYCYNLMVLSSEGVKSVDKSCDARMIAMEFVSNNSILYVVQNHKTGNFQVKQCDLSGVSVASEGCFVPTGIKGNFIDMKMKPEFETFLLYYYDGNKNLISEYDYKGTLISKKEVGAYYRLDLSSYNYFTAYNFNILNQRNIDKTEPIGAVFHEKDILDYCTSEDNKEMFTVSEDGILKKWVEGDQDLYLLVLENSDFITQVPISMKSSRNDVAVWMKKTEVDFTKYVNEKNSSEALRRVMEDDYLRTFDLNNMNVYSSKVGDAQNINFYAKFDLLANQSVYKVKVFHVLKKNGKYYVVQYCGSCINDFAFNPNDINNLIAVLPNDKIAILSNKDFAAYKNLEKNSIVTIKLNTRPINDTEQVIKSILDQ